MTPGFQEDFLNQVIFIRPVPSHTPNAPSYCCLVAIDQDSKALRLARQSQFD
jgi:hypothetical protein